MLLSLEPKVAVVTFRSPESHPRRRDEKGGSDKRTSVAEQQDNGPDPDFGRRHASALLPLTSTACFRPPREGPSDFSRDNETLSSLSFFFFRDTPCPVFFIANRALLRYYIRYDFAHLITATWTLLRQLISVLMFLIGRISLRLYRVHYRDKYTRHI